MTFDDIYQFLSCTVVLDIARGYQVGTGHNFYMIWDSTDSVDHYRTEPYTIASIGSQWQGIGRNPHRNSDYSHYDTSPVAVLCQTFCDLVNDLARV